MDTLKNALAEAKPTLVEVFSPRCSHCVDMEPVVAELRTRLADKANVIQIDGTVDQDIIHEYKIAAYPCWLLFKDGKQAWRDYGSKPLGELEHMVRDFI